MKTVLAGTLAGLGIVLVAVLLVAGRAGQLIWALALFGPVAWRWWKARQPPGTLGGAAPDVVETAMLSMRLDPASGTLSGRVLRGRWAGWDLSALDLASLRDLLAEAAAEDSESVPLVEAWLDRAHEGWREAADSAAPPSASSARAEALAILGLSEGATEAEIRAAHARLMRAAHPDAGGSAWLAARLNAARDTLLG
ncbi:molecular chaperone DnaJ [Roseomonas sp. KE2513]|nr:molecular chaperone DnaJ [Roseomonas sp. KE2513]